MNVLITFSGICQDQHGVHLAVFNDVLCGYLLLGSITYHIITHLFISANS